MEGLHGGPWGNAEEREGTEKSQQLAFSFICILMFVVEWPLVSHPLGMCSVPMTMPMVEPKCDIRLIVNHRCAARGWAGPHKAGEAAPAEHARVARSELFVTMVTIGQMGSLSLRVRKP